MIYMTIIMVQSMFVTENRNGFRNMQLLKKKVNHFVDSRFYKIYNGHFSIYIYYVCV